MKLSIQHRLLVQGEYWDFQRKILDAVQINDIVIIIFDYMEYPRQQQARNMEGYSMKKEKIWTAEHPTNQNTDTYINFVSESPLTACNFSSHTCVIDPQSGALLDAKFTK